MKPSDIIVGRCYSHADCPSTIFLGIGKRKMWTGDFSNQGEMDEKHLVIIQDFILPGQIGLLVKEGEDTTPDHWSKFKLV